MRSTDQIPVRTNRLACENIEFLSQGIELLESLTDEEYVEDHAPALSDGIGAHIRHIVDHYQCFFEGLRGDCIDYEARKRDSLISTHRLTAVAALGDIIKQLELIGAHAMPVDVYVEQKSASSQPGRQRVTSCVDRELQFLVSHTVHHYALLAVVMRLAGRPLRTGFGISPSTLRYQERQT